MGRTGKIFANSFKKIDAFSLELIRNFVEKGFIVDKSKRLVYTVGYINDVIKNNDFQSINDFTLTVQEIINNGISEATIHNKPFMYQNVKIKQVRYNIVVLSLAADTYFLVSFEKVDRLSSSVLNYRKDSESNLDIRLNEISNFLNNSLMAAISIDQNNKVINHTNLINTIFDFEEDIIGKDISSITPKFFNFPRILTNIASVSVTGTTKSLHTKTKDNITYNVRISPYYNYVNNIQVGVIVSFQDITLLKANEDELVRKKEEVEQILDTLNMGMINCEVITDKTNTPVDLKFLYVNERICDAINIEKQVLIGKTVLEVFPSIGSDLIELYGNIGLTMRPHCQIHHLDFIDGYQNIHGLSIIKGQVIITFVDVTETILAQKETEDKIVRHSMILESAKTGFFELNIKEKEIFYDNFVTELFHLELTYENNHIEFRKRIHSLDYERVTKLNDKVLSGELDKANHTFRFHNINTDEYVWIRQILMTTGKINNKPTRLLGLFTNIDEQKRQEEKSEEISFMLNETNKVANISRLLYYPDTETFEHSEELSNFLGVPNIEKIEDFRKIIFEDDLQIFDEATSYILKHPEGKVTKYRLVKDDEIRYIQSSIYGQQDDYGDTIKVYGLLKDITDLEEVNIELDQHRKAFEQIFNSSPAGIFLLDDKFKIDMVNNTYISLLQIDSFRDLSLKQLLGKDYHPIIKDLETEGKAVNYKIEYSSEGVIKFFNLNMVKINSTFTRSYQGTMIDITREVEITDQINFMANHDILTGLYNRNYFEDFISKNAKVYPSGIIVCDIDGLKVINDAFGHLNGDQLLISFAKILKGIFAEHMVARIGGDEFCIIVQHTTIDELENYEQRIKQQLNDLQLYGLGFDVSVGYSLMDNRDLTFLDAYVSSENMMYRRKLTERSSRKSKTLDTIMETLNQKTEETTAHCNRVGAYSELILREIGYARQMDIEEMRLLSRVHDIGKITISEEILSKPTILTKAEKDKVNQHAESGYKIVKSILDSENIAMGVLYHHERVDGTGYPHNLKGDQIPMFARVLAIADAYDAMINERPYRDKMTQEEAIEELLAHSGTQFDAEYVRLFIKVLKNPNH